MKARIPVKLKREAMAEINRLADREYQKVKDKEINDLTRRIFKTIVFALHKDFGFGRDRCAKANGNYQKHIDKYKAMTGQ